jgi:FOG: CheY-like receiver
MDHMMPEMDGVETTARIRAMGGRFEKIPIIALTANAVIGTKEMLLAAGLNDFLAKPIRKEELEEVLAKWIPDELKASQPTEDSPAVSGPLPYSQVLQRINEIEELDVKVGLEIVAGQQAVYERSLKLLQEKAPDISRMLEEYLAAGNIKEFSIHIHGIKGALSSIGARRLAQSAKNLEAAAGANDFDYCREFLPSFIWQLRSLGRRLGYALSETGTEVAKKTGDPQSLCRGLKQLDEALIGYDYETVGLCLDQLESVDYGPEVWRSLQLIRKSVESFDYEVALERLKILTVMLKGEPETQ